LLIFGDNIGHVIFVVLALETNIGPLSYHQARTSIFPGTFKKGVFDSRENAPVVLV
jgi:hypothetical protein